MRVEFYEVDWATGEDRLLGSISLDESGLVGHPQKGAEVFIDRMLDKAKEADDAEKWLRSLPETWSNSISWVEIIE